MSTLKDFERLVRLKTTPCNAVLERETREEGAPAIFLIGSHLNNIAAKAA
jgi:hypothetical protein